MRKVIYALTVSLDGFIEDANGDLSWSFPDEELHKHFNDREAMIDAHLYGRRMYELMAAYWPTADENPAAPAYEVQYAKIWKSKPKVVFSKTLDRVGCNSRLVRDVIPDEIKGLKEQPGKYMSVGGPALAAEFMRLGLIDEFWLYLSPIFLGAGKPMFSSLKDRVPVAFIETKHFGSGVVLLRYALIGAK
jgi:dihydrofolate reductase